MVTIGPIIYNHFFVLGVIPNNGILLTTTEEIDAFENGIAYTWLTDYGDGIIFAFCIQHDRLAVQIKYHNSNLMYRVKWTTTYWLPWRTVFENK